MQTLPWYNSAIIRQTIVQLLASVALLFGVSSDAINVEETVGLVLGGITGLTAIWTFITRLYKPTPPITGEAVEATAEWLSKQAARLRK